MKTTLSREKLIFGVATLLLAGAVYQHFATKPAALAVGQPVSAQLAPVALSEKSLADAQLSLAGGRKTPFAPPYVEPKIVVDHSDKPKVDKRGPFGERPPTRPDDFTDGEVTKDVTFEPLPKPNLKFIGIASTDTQTVGLIRADKGAPRLVKVGDEAAAEGYTVARIEKQSIQIDGRERIVLKDR